MNADAVSIADAPAQRRGPRVAKSLLIFLGLAVYFGVVWYFGWREIRDLLLGTDLVPVTGALGLFALGTGLRVYKWRYALGPNAYAVGLFFMSKASGIFSPARLGEFAPLLWHRHRTARVGGWLVLDRLLEVAATLLLGLVGLALIQLVAPWIDALLLAGFVVGCGISAYAVTRHGFLASLSVRFRNRPRIAGGFHALARTSEEIQAYRRRLPFIVVTTLLAKAVDLYAIVLIFRALGVEISFALASAAKCALVMVSFLPVTPVLTGVPHAAQGWLMNVSAGVSPEVTVASVGIEAALLTVLFWTSIGLAARSLKAAAL